MKHLTLTLVLFCAFLSFGQTTHSIGFYNVENLFDTLDHPKKNDNEYLPTAERKWNGQRYQTKIGHVNEVFDSIGRPMIFGLCEIENAQVVQDVIDAGPMKGKYDLVHFESLDQRGIDNALLYDSSLLSLVECGIIRFDMPAPSSPSRDIVWGIFSTNQDEQILAMVNHWPSRRGGQAKSEPKRMVAALSAKKFIDSVMTANKRMKIVFMGDLNDYPDNLAPMQISKLLTPMISEKSGEFGGSHNYRGEWSVLDHIMVSKSFFKGKAAVKKKSGKIHSPSFLKTTYKGNIVPFRTYGGRKYLDGYSDHFPVTIDVILKD